MAMNKYKNCYDKNNYTHYGWMYGIVPVYVDMTPKDCPAIEVRSVVFEPLMDVMESIFGAFCIVATMVNPEFEPQFAIKLTGEISK
jgi:hypothetical protein